LTRAIVIPIIDTQQTEREIMSLYEARKQLSEFTNQGGGREPEMQELIALKIGYEAALKSIRDQIDSNYKLID
jgi:hypothetical protein